MPQTCSRTIFHTKWKKDAVFAEVLERTTQIAREWKDGEALRALEEAARELALAAPDAVSNLVGRLESEDESIILRAAVAILDRAGIETASKAAEQTIEIAVVSEDVEIDEL